MTNTATLDWRPCRVVGSEAITPQARRITIERPVATGRPADPGAHLDVRVVLPSGATDVRSYSVVESDAAGRTFTLTVQLAQHSRGGSSYLHSLAVGDMIEATRPLQDFALLPGADSYVLLAGGIGVTALVGTARALKRMGADYRIVYAGRARELMAYAELLADEHGERLTLHVDAEGTPLDAAALVESVAGSAQRTELVMCGPVRLMDEVRRAWSVHGLSPVDLRFETFGSSGWYDAEPFEVSVPELGITTTVGVDQSMLDALSAAGAEVMWDCRKGECGLCAMRVVDREGDLDHRDVFFSDRQKDAGDRLCACVARVVGGDRAPTGRVSLTTL